MIFAFIAFSMFVLFDLNKIIWNNRKLNMLFPLGIMLLIYATYDCFIMGRSILDIADRVKNNIIFLAVAIFGIWKTYAVLFVALPFDETYVKTGKLPLVDKGAYAICRHPGFWYLMLAYFGLCKVFFSVEALVFTIVVNGLNLLYIYIEDVFVFPKTIYRYDDYKKRVPFLVPRR